MIDPITFLDKIAAITEGTNMRNLQDRIKRLKGVKGGFLLCLFFLIFFWCSTGWAQGVLSVEVNNGYNLIVDSNVTAPSTYAPKAAYIGAEICNTGDAAIQDVFAYVGNKTANTPGVFPSFSSTGDSRAHLANTGNYSLTLEADETGAADGTRYIGTLDPGECRMQYWLFSYPQCVNVDPDGDGTYEQQYPPCDTSITGGVKPDDDLSLEYDVWASGTSVATVSVEDRDFTMRNEISAAANKIWPNTDSKVPDAYLDAIESVVGWGTLGPDGQPLTKTDPIYPGQKVVTTQGIWYDLGNVVHGFDNDNDLIVDQNAWLQPVGDAGLFDADCFRMVRNYGIVIAKLKSGGEALFPFEDELYFTNLPDNTGVVGLVYYQFIATDQGCEAAMTPYQEAASGYDNEKFSSDYGLGLNLYSGSYGTDLTFSKTDGVASTSTGSTLEYTFTATNNSNVHLGAPDYGLPLTFTDSIPEGTTFVAASADDNPTTWLTEPSGTGTFVQGYTDDDGDLVNCTLGYEVVSSSFKLLYSSDNGAIWSASEPGTVTNIKWLLLTTLNLDGGFDGTDCISRDDVYSDGTFETSLPAGKSATLKFQVTVDSNGGPIICNTAGIAFGSANPAVEAQDCTLVTGNNSLSGTVFVDDGASGTGTYGDGIQNGSEAGIGNASDGVTVSLYYDKNGNGEYDSEDILYGTDTTDASGDYGFTNLPDGPYLVVAKKYDGESSDGTDNAVNDFNAGYGNTTSDPNLALTTDQGILKMTEELTTVTLAVNIDLDSSTTTAQTISTVDFGFMPPLEVTKSVSGNADADDNGIADTTIDEGDEFSYIITLENRLPNVGVQGPTGCQYTVWTITGTNGSPSSKEFTNFANAFDAKSPNRTTAYTEVTGGGTNFLQASTFSMSQKPGNITKVEGLIFGYFDQELTDDFLRLETQLAGETDITDTISTAQIESYVGEPEDTDANSAISWDISKLRPGGTGAVGDWGWTDFGNLTVEINPSKTAAADAKTFYLDAVGLRVTTDQDCVAGSSTTLSPVPLQDTYYDNTLFEFVSATPTPTSVDITNGLIKWDDVGPILPGTSTSVKVTMKAKDVTGTINGTCSSGSENACNQVRTDYDSKNVKYADGRQANDDSDEIAVNIQGKAELRGKVWNDADNDGWAIDALETGLPNVTVSLYACMQSDNTTLETGTSTSKDCAQMSQNNYWAKIKTAVTDANGDYEFIGLDSGYYIIEVNDSDGSPAAGTGGNSPPYDFAQTAEPDDDQSSTSTNADAPSQGTFNNTWGVATAILYSDQRQINFLDQSTEETINGINFGYYNDKSTIYGNVWHDVDGDATEDPGDDGLSGFTVKLYDDADGDGEIDAGESVLATTTTDSNGNYAFTDISHSDGDDFIIKVTPPTLLTKVWTETVESTGGTGDLDNEIAIADLTSGSISGSHDFGYTQKDTSNIGDTLYIDFNGNGILDSGEEGIANVTVYLYKDVDRDGKIDDGVDALIKTDVTDSSGNYLFEDLPNGSYLVKVDTSDSDFPDKTTATADPDINSGSIGDQVWLDANGDGNLDSGETGIPNVVVRLYEDTNGNGSLDVGTDKIVAATATDVNGKYLFTALNAGKYFVDIDETSLPGSGLAITTTDPATTLVTLATRTSSVLTADAGYSPSGTSYAIGDFVWYDDDFDGVKDPGEAGIGGVDITVTDGTSTYTTTTDESGYYIVTGLSNSTSYTISVDTSDINSSFYTTTGGDSQNKTISSADDMSADFGYKYDPEKNGTFDDADEVDDEPTGIITGAVFKDADGDEALDSGEAMSGVTVNLFDSDNNLVATTTTDASGSYSFTGVSIGTYSVQAVDKTGTRYSTIFLSAGETFSDLNVIYNATSLSTADGLGSVSIGGVYDDLRQDFGYQRFLGSIGDTIYLDINQNADQDIGEPGIDGIDVFLYLWADAVADGGDGDGEIDAGELTLQKTKTTTADDPATSEDESGKYLFSNLPDPPENQEYLVRVDTSDLPSGYVLIGDPDTDGTSCVGYSPASDCDNQQVVDAYEGGYNYTGADFGYYYQESGNAFFGDYIWVDSDGDGTKDTGESGIPFITVFVDTDDDGTLDWTDGNSNGVWDSGEGERWVETNSDGYYLFSSLSDGTYSNVKVLTGDSDWPSGLSTTPVFEVRSGNTGSLNSDVDVVISGGKVTSIVDGDSSTTDTCTDCDLDVDFGYRYSGSNTLSGTLCIEPSGSDGICGDSATDYSGVNSSGGEAALTSITVAFYQWGDDGDDSAWDVSGNLDSGDTFTYLGSTSTDANGDYSYSNLPDNVIVLFSVSETRNVRLVTQNDTANQVEDGNVLRQGLYEKTTTYNGNTVTTLGRQALDISLDADNVIQDLDFAFTNLVEYDFGDLPDTGTTDYNSTLLTSGGAQHVVTGSSIYMGTDSGEGVSTENDGKDVGAGVTEDDKDDGVEMVSSSWTAGSNGASVTLQASADGWAAGWIDFNGDGDFEDDYERLFSKAVTSGDNTISFYVPASAVGRTSFYARFRIYPEEPAMVASTGMALDSALQPTTGEVEDYLWTANVTYVLISDFKAYAQGNQVVIEWQTSAEIGTVGFHIERLNPSSGKYKRLNKDLMPAMLTSTVGGTYRFVDHQAQPGGNYTYYLVEVEDDGDENRIGPFTVIPMEILAEPMTEDFARQGFEISDEVSARLKKVKDNRDKVLFNNRKRSGNVVKIHVPESGLYYLDAARMAEFFDVSEKTAINAIQTNHIALTSKGKDVAYLPADNDTGIYFYGESIDSIYSRDNVYWLKMEKGVQMNRVKVKSKKLPEADATDTFTHVSHVEENRYAITGVDDPETDFFTMDFVFAGYAGMDQKSFTVPSPDLDIGADATLTVRLVGATDTPAVQDHHAVISINGTEIGSRQWGGIAPTILIFNVDASLLREGENTVQVSGIKGAGVTFSVFYVDYLELGYQRYYNADQGQLLYNVDQQPVATISGFDDDDVMTFDITDPRAPVLIEAQPVWNQGKYSASYEPAPYSSGYMISRSNVIAVEKAWVDEPSTLSLTGNRADYLVIAPAELIDGAQRLADYRKTQGFDTMVVQLEDIMDEFNDGIYSPWAIRDFLSFAYRQWETGPQYVVLAGNGTFDYKDYMGAGDNLMPTIMVSTPHGLFPSDNRYGDLEGDDGIPEIAIGRIPVLLDEELQVFVDKVIAYESALGGSWSKRVLLLADNPDSAGNFPSDSNALASILTDSYDARKIYLSDMSAGAASAEAKAQMNSGVGFVSYLGHGGMDRIAQEGLITSAHVPGMNNTVLPVMNFMSCLTGRFEYPGYDVIAEKLVQKSGGGAIAVWSASGMSENWAAVILAKAYFRETFVNGEPVLGKSILKALQAFGENRHGNYMLDIYNLMGDPALRLR